MKRLSVTILFTCFCCLLRAQEYPVKLYIVDKQNNPISKVEMTIVGNNMEKLISDNDGLIQFQAAKGTEVVLSKYNQLLGKVIVSSEKQFVILDENNHLLEIGYDERLTKESTSLAVNGTTAKEMSVSGQTNVMNTLYGLIPGLTVMQGENLPWQSNPNVYVRGRGSLGGNNVIVLVDGIERDLTNVHTEEIESVTVLKDAAALALYGNRGADGVVCFTTKRGGEHNFRTHVNYNFSVQNPFRIPAMADAYNYGNALNEALCNDGMAPRYTQYDLRNMLNGTNNKLYPNINWKKELLRNAGFNHDLNLSFDGTSKRMRYYVFADYSSNKGIFNNTNLNDGYSTQTEMYSLRLRTNLETDISPTSTLRINLMGHLQQYQYPTVGTDLKEMYNTPSAAFPIKSNNVWLQSQMFKNPLAQKTAQGYTTMLQRTLFADLTFDQDLSMLMKGLSAQLRISYDNSADMDDTRAKEYAYDNVTQLYNESGNIYDYLYTRYGNDTELVFNNGVLTTQLARTSIWAKLNYARDFNAHHLKAMAIFSQGKSKFRGANNTFMYRDYILNAEYNYNNRYIVNGVLTYAGSAKLVKGDKYRLYPAVSAAWVISNEKFMKNAKNVDFLKLRASYGIVGNDSRLSYDMDKRFNGSGKKYIFVGTQLLDGMTHGALASTDIEPEKDYKMNVGIELGLFNGLAFEMDGFYNRRKNIRVNSAGSVSSILGVGASDVFTGEVKNYGTEIALEWKQRIKDFGYHIQGTFSYVKNEIIRMEEAYHPYEYMYQTGQAIDRFYGLVADGFYQESDFDDSGKLQSGVPVSTFTSEIRPGDVKYKDLNSDGRIDEYDNTYQLYSNLPEIYYGFNIGAYYKNVGFNAYFQGAGHFTVTTDLESIYQPLYGNDKNISNHYLENYWTRYTPNARYPRLTTLSNNNNYRASSLWTEKGDFLKLRALEIYYKFPKQWIKKMHMNECRFFLKGMNLFSIDHIDIMDPEYISMGYPSMRSYQIGVNVLF
ncbi:SusC/RagA family TonB-linked outer membrane protein [Bacteroides ovatus]|jgi:TonB-linked SusC/RagA family outer membrane protein|uniref:TonB-linked outer membrane protein, SusC/RagA family n=1 Tax=Bacteroides ovatus TaxID=28116 RepID=A0A1G8D471_BACOV|nr:SusC/RagA family TonB-linked outer membrane protein [Bacteroides ovatus]SDH52304.1 TonB-linked outer membrane protein, SusC/RagA family [Bacteroides ovatus]